MIARSIALSERTGQQNGRTMADVPSELACGLDSVHPSEPEDFTDWPINEEIQRRLDECEAADVHGPKGWRLKGDDS